MKAHDDIDFLSSLMDRIERTQAQEHEIFFVRQNKFSINQRLKKCNIITQAQTCHLGLRVFIDEKSALVSAPCLKNTPWDQLIEQALEMAKAAPKDPHCQLAEHAQHARTKTDDTLELCDPSMASDEQLKEWVRECEDSALSVQGITNSYGASATRIQSHMHLLTSKGFHGHYHASNYRLGTAVLAQEQGEMNVDYSSTQVRHHKDMGRPADIGKKAAKRALKGLNGRKISSQNLPVIFSSRVSPSLLGHFSKAINGQDISQGISFLKNKLHHSVFSSQVHIVDDPHMKRGLGSCPFDGEGIENQKHILINQGVLEHYLLDLKTANKLSLSPTGHAQRHTSCVPFPEQTNMYMEPGNIDEKDLIKNISQGLYITNLSGMGVNTVTGDYSRGASGFFIDQGQITYRVHEITLASNLKDMFKFLVPANNLEFKHNINAPSVLIETMAIGGS